MIELRGKPHVMPEILALFFTRQLNLFHHEAVKLEDVEKKEQNSV